MKQIIFLAVLAIASISGITQNIEITFTGKGEATVVDSVTATNLANNESITVPGNVSLILTGMTGVIDLVQSQMQIHFFPNPFNNVGQLTVYLNHQGYVEVSLRNIIGQLMCSQSKHLPSDEHSFNISIQEPGIYFVNVASSSRNEGLKIICTEAAGSTSYIEYIGIAHNTLDTGLASQFKAANSQFTLKYKQGDYIHYKGHSGKFTTIITDSVIESKAIELEFINCTDNDGRTYEVVKIDEQIWMAENLAYLPTIDSANRGAYFVYGYNGAIIEEAKATDNYKTYGVLYKGRSSTISCPNDWHLPSDEDWIQLESSLGMNESDHNSEGWRISGNVGRKLKSRDGWKNGGNGSNSSGFNALPGGYHFL
ncbi:MAG: T9SS type A sorting domain-containing protein, partial [Bacteroidetes bacterium]|nr:T9SS type A sorting domain-containing protein [Bacteroidota bacterium]